ncbi:tetratricopeptide repeat protein [Streptomyces ureilyticus]|uniref:Tetratricopeptide repeat protein n=1 Tax=Streptomyces ureilyticus TaxID=1775131 RepID=A0ABX0E648_9ACTN|nr:ATP-binding protein [Streptomyces ureilyticus]NGO46607.1 tetratricopeptide repeat protein [Streptomyces ureilyticus]
MAPRPGGETDKFGNRYEGAWTIRHALYVLLGQGDSLTLEPSGVLGEGTEFAYRHNGRTEVHQVKRQNRNANGWNVASLEAKGIWRHLRTHAEASHDFHFVSMVPARPLQELGDRARRSDDFSTFIRDWLTDQLRAPFDELAAPGIFGAPETVWRMLRSLWVEWPDERDVVAMNAALAEKVLSGAPGRLAALALGDLLLNSLGTRLDARAIMARLPQYGLWHNVKPENSAAMAPVSGIAQTAPDRVIPRTTPALSGLPSPSGTFTGRDAVVAELLSALDPGTTGEGPSVHVVAGLPGVGKTELIRQVAHRAQDQDGWFCGALAVELYGYDPARRQSPDEALASMLRGLGIDHEHLPVDLEDRARLYRSTLRSRADQGQRTLIVLDDAMDSEQVHPLLPGDARVPVLITSRHTLSELDARLYDLAVLDPADSVDLLRLVLRATRGKGDTRVEDAFDTAEAIARHCGHLPLALRIVAALLADQPDRPLSSMAQALDDEHRRLRRLSRGNLAVRAAFELSYRHLPPDQARLFRLFALNPGPDVSTESVAHLCDIDPDTAEELLGALGRGHLVQSSATYGRWHMHDLIRLYADETGRTERASTDRSAALDRLVRHYADRLAEAHDHLVPGQSPAPRFADRGAALSWLDEERANLVATITATSPTDNPYVIMEMAGRIGDYLKLRRGYAELTEIYDSALRCCAGSAPAAFRAAFLDAQACALRGLTRFPEAVAAHEEALRIHRAERSLLGEAEVLTNLGHTLHEMRDIDRAVLVLRKAVVLQGKAGNLRGEGAALTNLGRALDESGRYEEAVGVYQRDIEICRRIDDWHGEAVTQNNLGLALRELGRASEAAVAHTAARDAFHRAGDHHGVAMALTNLSSALRAGGLGDGSDLLEEAAALCHDLGDKQGEGVALTNLATNRLNAKAPAEAVRILMSAYDLLKEAGATHALAKALMNLGKAWGVLGRQDRAIEAVREAITLYRTARDRHGEGRALFLLSSALWATDPEEAISVGTAAVTALGETDDETLTGQATALLATMRESIDGGEIQASF